MFVTEEDITQKLDQFRVAIYEMGALYKLNAPIQMMEAVYNLAKDYHEQAGSIAKSYCAAHKPKDEKERVKRLFKDSTGTVSIKVDLVGEMDSPRLLRTLMFTKDAEDRYVYRDQFLARPKWCKFTMSEMMANPIEGINLNDYKLKDYFRASLTTTPKMYALVDHCVTWALDGVGISQLEPGTDKLDQYMATLDSIKRACRDLEIARQ